MASCVRNIHTKNHQNLTIGFQVTFENVGDAYLGHSVAVSSNTWLAYTLCFKKTGTLFISFIIHSNDDQLVQKQTLGEMETRTLI